MLKFFGAVNTLVAALEPPLGIPVHNGPNTQANLAVFMVLFMLCAIEVVFIKIVTSVDDDIAPNHHDHRFHHHHRHRSPSYPFDDTNNNHQRYYAGSPTTDTSSESDIF